MELVQIIKYSSLEFKRFHSIIKYVISYNFPRFLIIWPH